MREQTQTNGCGHPPAKRRRTLSLGGGFCMAWLAVWALPAAESFAQNLKVGPFGLTLAATAELAYDSNVDDAYPEEEKEGFQKGDFYWMPGLSIQSQAVPMRPSTTFSLGAQIAYQDFFTRNDLDTEIYNVALNFQTTHPRLTLGGMASADYSVEGVEDQYVPGGSTRDPVLTREGSLFANWNYRKLRIETSAEYSEELHEEEEFQEGDQEETTLSAGVYYDLFTWGSLFYSWENTVTTQLQSEEEKDETTHTFGLDGTIPVELLRRPKITYTFGFSYEDEQTDGTEGEEEPSWDPTHTITVQDEFQLSKSVNLSMSATWEDTWTDNEPSFAWPGEDTGDEDEVTFQYEVLLSQTLGSRAKHELAFSQEPEATFGSNTDTESTTYRYNFELRDLLVYGLNFNAGAEYELETPLGEGAAETEKTTILRTGLAHTRQFSRKLSRTLTYDYTWEDSNFHEAGANEKHLVIYRLTYLF